MAADAFLPLLNQLISQGGCQEGVRSGGLWGAPDLGAAMPNARDSGLSKPPEEKGVNIRLPLVKITSRHVTKHLQSAASGCLLPVLHSSSPLKTFP